MSAPRTNRVQCVNLPPSGASGAVKSATWPIEDSGLLQVTLARRSSSLKAHCKRRSAKRITPKNSPVDFCPPATLTLKKGSWFHPSKPAAILSNFGFCQFQALITGPSVRVAFGTAKPDMHRETGHARMPVPVRKCLRNALFRAIPA